MFNETYLPILFVILANILFSSASVGFAHYSKKFGANWMAMIKVLIGGACIAVVFLFQTDIDFLDASLNDFIDFLLKYKTVFLLFMISGMIGLGVGDIFLLNAYKTIGASRSLILFGFQPILLGVVGYLFLDQSLSTARIVSIVFMILCLCNFLFEALMKSKNQWTVKGMIFAFLAVLMDAGGLTLTRLAYDQSSEMTTVEANFFRFLGSIIFYLILNKYFVPTNLVSKFQSLNFKNKGLVIVYSVMGTFLSLMLYLAAVKMAPLASLTSISITGPVFATFIESIVEQKRPSKNLVVSLLLFSIGILCLSFE